MAYKVIITENALKQLESIADYLVYRLHNKQAAAGVLGDFEQICRELTYLATSMPVCNDRYLSNKGYRKIALAHYKYIALYQMKNDVVYVNGIFHMLENYSKKL